MDSMFRGIGNFNSFNQPIGNWDTGNVTTMFVMFGTSNFNQPIGNWNISKVTKLNNMFSRNRSFNQPLNDWNTGNVTTIDSMFYKMSGDSPHTFNQPLDKWNTSKMTEMGMFSSGHRFTNNALSLKNWNF
jgi:surface protein